MGYIAAVLLIAISLRQTVKPIRKTMLPVAVLGGFILLLAKEIGLIDLDENMLSALTYHGIALGFIAMSLRNPVQREAGDESKVGFRSGAVIVSTYMIQGVTGLIITIGLALTVMPNMFRAAGLLLPMGFGQGPGQANNIGASYQSLGFEGGHSFGLSIAAAGYIVACFVGVIILNLLRKSGELKLSEVNSMTVLRDDHLGVSDSDDVAESIDKLSVQLAMIVIVYLATYVVTAGITGGIAKLSEGLAGTVNTLLWGFNFIIGSALAILLRVILEKLSQVSAASTLKTSADWYCRSFCSSQQEPLSHGSTCAGSARRFTATTTTRALSRCTACSPEPSAPACCSCARSTRSSRLLLPTIW